MPQEKLPEERQSFWVETGYKKTYPTLRKDETTDIVVIGGGIAGILTSYTLAKEGYKVILLEARQLLNGTTGFTTAKLSAQHQLIYDELIARYGKDTALLYYEANMAGIRYIEKIAKELNFDCQLTEQKAYVYTQEKDKLRTFKQEAEAYVELGINGRLVDDVPLEIKVEAALEMDEQAQFHPVTFLHHVLDSLDTEKVKIYEQSLVEDIRQNDDESIAIKIANDKEVTCQKAVFATHFPIFDPDNHYAKMKPQMSYALALKTKKEHPDGMYINDDIPKRTFRTMQVNGEDYLLVGGQSHPVGDKYDELERYMELAALANNTFGETDIVYRWSSHDLMTEDRIPFIGKLHLDYPHLYTLTGFSKWGLANAATGAKVITDLIQNNHNPYKKIYDPYREISSLDEKETVQEEEVHTLELVGKPEQLQENEATIMEKDDESIGVYKDKNGNLHYLDISCTHLGCHLNWNKGDTTWDCPCHGSRFHATGAVLAGPALKDLTKKHH